MKQFHILERCGNAGVIFVHLIFQVPPQITMTITTIMGSWMSELFADYSLLEHLTYSNMDFLAVCTSALPGCNCHTVFLLISTTSRRYSIYWSPIWIQQLLTNMKPNICNAFVAHLYCYSVLWHLLNGERISLTKCLLQFSNLLLSGR
jgi:hypothetical protein